MLKKGLVKSTRTFTSFFVSEFGSAMPAVMDEKTQRDLIFPKWF